MQLHYELAQEIFDGLSHDEIVNQVPKLQALSSSAATEK